MSDAFDNIQGLGFDPAAIRRKYEAEARKRLAIGRAPVQRLGASVAVSSADPFAAPIERAALHDEVDVVVVGAGFTGLMAAGHLRKAGIPKVRIIDKAGGFGGVWYWSRYPGIRCDVDSYVYLPLLEEVGTVPSEKYTHGDEIRAHCAALAERFQLDEAACLQTQVTGMEWDESAKRWRISTDRGDEITAQFVCLGNGTLDLPVIPDVPGLDQFEGKVFHSSRWDFDYTGGHGLGNMTKLADKEVVVVGTAASAIQFIPYLAQDAKHLTVLQRTPVIVNPRGNEKTDVAWFRNQPTGWQLDRMENFTANTQSPPWRPLPERDAVDDSTTRMMRASRQVPAPLANALQDVDPPTRALVMNYAGMERIRASMASLIDDPETAEKIKPYYNLGCKRPQFSDTYLQSYNRPNVTLVDTEGHGVERVTPTGVVVNGQEYRADCIIFATGFEVTGGARRAGTFPVVGRDGVVLSEKWEAGARSLHGVLTTGFPNLFIIGDVSQAAFTFNFTQLLAIQADYIARIVSRCRAEGIATVEVKPEAEAAWMEQVALTAAKLPKIDLGCLPDEIGAILRAGYPGGPLEYMQLVGEWLDSDYERDLITTNA